MFHPRPDADRREFFRTTIGEWIERTLESTESRVAPKRYFRPPGALPEMGFLAACTRCGDCLPVCPPRAIVQVRPEGGLAAGTPYIDPGKQPCTVCPDMPCVRACPTGALTMPAHGWEGYRLGALELDSDRCITFHGKPCGVCATVCPIGEKALAMDEAGHPVIRVEGCVGCGICVRACVTIPSSLDVRRVEA